MFPNRCLKTPNCVLHFVVELSKRMCTECLNKIMYGTAVVWFRSKSYKRFVHSKV